MNIQAGTCFVFTSWYLFWVFKKISYQPSIGTGSLKNFHTSPVVLVIGFKADFWLI